jgi:VanZ family protein
VILSLVPPELRPETGAPHDLEHFLIYGATGIAFSLGYHLRVWFLVVSFAVFAGCVEMVQLFVPGRHARFRDFIVDAVAMWLGVLTVSLINEFRARA